MDTTAKPDKYDEQVKHLTEHPEKIRDAWMSAEGIFGFAIPRGERRWGKDGAIFGCLTQVKSHTATAWTEELTKAIRADDRIPALTCDIDADNLPILAEWRRRIDRELARV